MIFNPECQFICDPLGFPRQTIFNLGPITFTKLRELGMSLLSNLDILHSVTIYLTDNNYKYVLYPK